MALLTVSVFCGFSAVCAHAEDESGKQTLKIPVTLSLDEVLSEEEHLYTFELIAKDGAPVPAAGTTLQMDKAMTASFESIEFSDAGEYSYEIRQTTAKARGMHLDQTVYQVTVYLYWDDSEVSGPEDEEELKLVLLINKEGSTKKTEEISFSNTSEESIGRLKITKTLTAHEHVGDRIDPATFVFKIDIKDGDNKIIYSDVVSMVFNSSGSQTVEIDNLPAETTAVVSEVYRGANYIISGPEESEVVIKDDKDVTAGLEEIAAVSFVNDYDDTWHGSGSVTNHFQAGDKGWSDKDSTKSYSDGTVKGIKE